MQTCARRVQLTKHLSDSQIRAIWRSISVICHAMAKHQLPTQEELRQEVEQLSAANLTEELERVHANRNKELLVTINEKEREEERKRVQQQLNWLEQLQAASVRAVEELKANEKNAYHEWLRKQDLMVTKDGVPSRPMFKEEFEEYWSAKRLAIPVRDLGIFGSEPQTRPVPQYKKRDDGSWRWEERECNATLFAHDRHPLCKCSSRKLAVLGPVEPAATPDPSNPLARLAAEVAKAASKEGAAAAAAAKQQHRKEASRRPKKTSGQHESGRCTPEANKSKRASAAADAEPAAAVGGKLTAGKRNSTTTGKAGGLVNPESSSAGHGDDACKAAAAVQLEPSNSASAATARTAMAAGTGTEAEAQAVAWASRKQQMTKTSKSAATAGAEQQSWSKTSDAEMSWRVSDALHKAARKLLALGSLGSAGKHSSSSKCQKRTGH